MKTIYSTMLFAIGFLAVVLMFPSAHLRAEPIGNPNNSPAYATSNVNQPDIKGVSQSESPLLLAQTSEEHHSSTSSSSSSTEVPAPVQEDRSSESSSSSMKTTITTQAPLAAEDHHCAARCSDHYNASLSECNEPHHPHHGSCEKWARERQDECLATCNRD